MDETDIKSRPIEVTPSTKYCTDELRRRIRDVIDRNLSDPEFNGQHFDDFAALYRALARIDEIPGIDD